MPGFHITVLLSQLEEVTELLEYGDLLQSNLEAQSPDLNYLASAFFENARWDFEVAAVLTKNGIAASLEIEGDYDAGPTELDIRFTEQGDLQRIQQQQYEANPPLNDILPIIDDHQALKAYILQRKAQFEVLPWDNQVEYGKRYLAKQLLVK